MASLYIAKGLLTPVKLGFCGCGFKGTSSPDESGVTSKTPRKPATKAGRGH